MNSQALARDYLRKGKARRHALQILFEEGSYDDVVREAQAIVELILKGTLRFIGVDPPKRHDVGSTVKEFGDRLPESWPHAWMRSRLSPERSLRRGDTPFTVMRRLSRRPQRSLARKTPSGPSDVDEPLELFGALLQDRQDEMPNGDDERR
jgi:HEPN domain-containing protein